MINIDSATVKNAYRATSLSRLVICLLHIEINKI